MASIWPPACARHWSGDREGACAHRRGLCGPAPPRHGPSRCAACPAPALGDDGTSPSVGRRATAVTSRVHAGRRGGSGKSWYVRIVSYDGNSEHHRPRMSRPALCPPPRRSEGCARRSRGRRLHWSERGISGRFLSPSLRTPAGGARHGAGPSCATAISAMKMLCRGGCRHKQVSRCARHLFVTLWGNPHRFTPLSVR